MVGGKKNGLRKHKYEIPRERGAQGGKKKTNHHRDSGEG